MLCQNQSSCEKFSALATSSPLSPKVMVSVFLDKEGLILLDYLPKSKTTNSELCLQIIERRSVTTTQD